VLRLFASYCPVHRGLVLMNCEQDCESHYSVANSISPVPWHTSQATKLSVMTVPSPAHSRHVLPNSCPVPSQAAQRIDSVHEDSKPVALHAGQRAMFASMSPAVGYIEEKQPTAKKT
jgi:hypothetical protein